jgi:hypothetical protein
MRNAVQSMLNAIDREAGGVAMVLCPDFGLRDWLVEQVESLVPEEAHALRVFDVEAALAEPTRLVLLIPKDEREAVLDLDASRDRILQEPARSQKGDRQGRGAGGHAALHCHVGPDLETAPEVRVPLPAINAAEALDWVLSQIIPTDGFEPAPWADVQAALQKASA